MKALLARGRDLLGVGVLLLAAAAFGGREAITPDVFFHLHVGDRIREMGTVPDRNEFLAFHRDRPYVASEWLFGVALSKLYEVGGTRGIWALQIGLTALSVLVVYVIVRRSGPAAALDVAGAFMLVAAPRFLPAPELCSILFVALFLAILEARERRPWLPVVLIPLAALWANLHGFFPLGIGLLGCYLAGDLVHRRSSARSLLLLLPAVCLATLLTPNGVEGAVYPFRVLGASEHRAAIAAHIVELRSPILDQALSRTFEARLYQVALAGSAIALLISLPRVRVERLLSTAAFVAMSVPYVRNVAIFAAVALPLAALSLGQASPALRVRDRLCGRALPWASVGAWGGAALVLLLCARSVLGARWHRSSLEEVQIRPGFAAAIDVRAAVDFYVRHGLPSTLWTDFSSGHCVLYQGRGALRPALCPQTDLYPTDLLVRYTQTLTGARSVAELISTYPADAFLVDHRRTEGSALLADLLSSPDWSLIYADTRASVFVRTTGLASEAATRLRIDRSRMAADPDAFFGFAGLGAETEVRERLAAASFLLAAGEAGAAELVAARVAELRPDWPPTRFLLGRAARLRGDLDSAKSHLRAAMRGAPDSAAVHHELGLVHLRLEELGRAEEELRRAYELAPDEPAYRENLRTLYYLLGRDSDARALTSSDPDSRDAATRQGAALARFHEAVRRVGENRLREAEELYSSAIELDPHFADAYFNLGNLYARLERFEQALEAYDRVVELRPADGEAHFNRGVALRELGRTTDAVDAWRRCLAVDRGHGRARAALEASERQPAAGRLEGDRP